MHHKTGCHITPTDAYARNRHPAYDEHEDVPVDPHALLHPTAIALTAMAVVLHPGIRDRSCVGDVLAGAAMLLAMVDAMWIRIIPTVFWLAALVLGALCISALRSVRSRSGRESGGACRSSHTPLGFVVTAACLPFMQPPTAVQAAVSGGGHAHHALGAGSVTALVVLLAGGYLVISLIAARLAGRGAERAHFLLMGSGSALMALAAAL